MCVLSHSVVSDSRQLHEAYRTPQNFPGKNTGAGYHFLLEGIIPTQKLNPHLLHLLTGRQILYHCTTWDGEGNGTPLHYSCLENPRDGGAWWAAVSGVTQSRTRLSSSSSSTNLSPGHKRSVFSTFSPVLVLCCLFDSSRLTGERRCLVVVLIAFSFMISDVEHLFMCILAI